MMMMLPNIAADKDCGNLYYFNVIFKLLNFLGFRFYDTNLLKIIDSPYGSSKHCTGPSKLKQRAKFKKQNVCFELEN